MNRLVPTQSRRVVCLTAAFWLLTTLTVSAQFSMPASGAPAAGSSNQAAAEKPSGQPTLAAGQKRIGQARGALQQKDFTRAVNHYRRAAEMVPAVPELAEPVQTLKKQLVGAGIDAALLELPAPDDSGVQPLGAVDGATPLNAAAAGDVDARKSEVLRLIAVGRAALDRGDVAQAVRLARRAQSLNVPERAFQAGEPRVWQFLLDAESAARRSGIQLTSGETGSPNSSGVQRAGGAPAGGDAGDVARMLFQTDAGTGGAAGANVRQVQNENAVADADQPSAGQRFYQEGLEALSAGDKPAARAKFVEAWKYEGELDLSTRRQLKDKLTLLQPSRLPSPEQGKPAGPLTPIEKADLQAQQQMQRLYREVTTELAKSNEMKTSAPLDALDRLESLRRRVDGASVDDAAKRSLMSMVNRALTEQKQYVEANRAQIDLDLKNESIRTEMATEDARESRIDEEVSALVETFNGLIEERRYQEAEVVAKQVSELKPGSPIATSMFHTSRMGTRMLMHEEVRADLEESFAENLMDVERSAVAIDPDRPFAYPEARQWSDLSSRRLDDGATDSRLSAAEQAIKRKLATEVSVKYENEPLADVLDDLSAMTDVPIVMDKRALSAVRVTRDTPVSLNLSSGIALKSALNIILGDLELTHLIENDVLTVTSMEAKRSRVFPRTYRVTDLVTPIPNFTSSYDDGLAGALRAAYQMASPQTDVQVMPVSMTDLGSGMAKSMSPSSMSPNALGQYHPMGASNGFGPQKSPLQGKGGGSFADFDSLMQLIQTTVVPDTWEALGGPSTMAPYPQNLSLVISTTSDVHDQIVDLLESLRRLQNLQITIEVRFITLSDSFFEQIGVDFDLNVDDNLSTQLPPEDSGPSVSIGINADRTPTADLDIQLRNNSFGVTPPFGGSPTGAATTLGFAILSDIEAFFFLQAAQGDNRSNIMQAPKVTLFDGQIATISDTRQQPFVTSITPVVGDFAVAQQPVIVVLSEGTQLNVQGVVSDDKRYVRLTLVPFFSQIGEVDTFTFEGERTTSRSSRSEKDTDGDGDIDEDDAVDEENETEVVSGTTVQLPTFASTTVSTTVSVPDGGTILLGGIKTMSEGRVERGTPMLSKIPYLSRLFRNTAVGRDTSSLMLMVTPRIIIQEEEEIAQTGFDPRR